MTGWTPPALPAQWTWTAQLPPWVGRRAELDRLECIWAAVEHGVRQLLLVAGEPGSGKSRLVMEAAWALHKRGVPVLVGACTSDFGLPFDPLVPPLRGLLAAVERGELALADAEGASAEEARHLLSVLTSAVSPEATAERFAAVALGAVVSALTSACAHGPVVLVLEEPPLGRRVRAARPALHRRAHRRPARALPVHPPRYTARRVRPRLGDDGRADALAGCPSHRPRELRHRRRVLVPATLSRCPF